MSERSAARQEKSPDFAGTKFLRDEKIPEAIRESALKLWFDERHETRVESARHSTHQSKGWLSRLPVPIIAGVSAALGSMVTIAGDYLLKKQETDLTVLSERNEFQLRMIERYLDVDDVAERATSLWFLHDVGILPLSDDALQRWSKDIIDRRNKAAIAAGESPPELSPPRLGSDSPANDITGSVEGISIGDQEMDAIARVVASEVGHLYKYGESQLIGAAKAVVDVVLNRVGNPRYPDKVLGVIDQPFQFSAINSLGSWTGLPPTSDRMHEIVKNHLFQRVMGQPDTTNGAVVFLNPHLSSATALTSWGNFVVNNSVAVFGNDEQGDAVHFGYPPGSPKTPPYDVIYDGSEPLVRGQLLRNTLVKLALDEHKFFRFGSGKETEDPYYQRVSDYWEYLDFPFNVNVAESPWSSVFVSYLIRKAGLGGSPYYSTKNSDLFQQYVDASVDEPFVALPPEVAVPKPGDILHYGRLGSGKLTFDSAREAYKEEAFYPSHSDIVVSVNLSEGTLKAIGGNVSNSVSMKTVKLDENGQLKPRRENGTQLPWIGILSVRD